MNLTSCALLGHHIVPFTSGRGDLLCFSQPSLQDRSSGVPTAPFLLLRWGILLCFKEHRGLGKGISGSNLKSLLG